MTIPVDDTRWHRMAPNEIRLPNNHYAEYTMSGGELIVRIVGPNAHVTGNSVFLEEAIAYALDWFNEVGGEL
jgi:hypothetical protein